MANYHTLFSEKLQIHSEEEREWLEAALQSPLDLEGDDLTQWADRLGVQAGQLEDAYCGDYEWYPGFDYGLAEQSDQEYLWMKHADTGNPEHVATLVSVFLAKFRPDELWTMEWAYTCSTPRYGAFSGGGMVVSAETVVYVDVGQQVHRILADMEKEVQQRS